MGIFGTPDVILSSYAALLLYVIKIEEYWVFNFQLFDWGFFPGDNFPREHFSGRHICG